MALAPLATAADLSARNIDITDTATVNTALAIASGAVRDAAESTISQETSTVSIAGPHASRLLSLPGPVISVDSVTIGTSPVVDYEIQPNGLYRRWGWATVQPYPYIRDFGWQNPPPPIVVTYTHGLSEVPADIVDLTCQLAIAWLNHRTAGGGSTAGLVSAAIDDAREQYTPEAAGQVSPVFIPEVTRRWLAARFGGGSQVVETL